MDSVRLHLDPTRNILLKNKNLTSFFLALLFFCGAVNVQADLITPPPDTKLNSKTVTFEWEDIGASQYWLYVGTKHMKADIYNQSQGLNTSVTVDLRSGGTNIYATLFAKIDGNWSYIGYSYYNTGEVVKIHTDTLSLKGKT